MCVRASSVFAREMFAVRAIVLAAAKRMSSVWIVVIWRVRSAGLVPSNSAANLAVLSAFITRESMTRRYGVRGLS